MKDLQPLTITVDVDRHFTVWTDHNTAVADLDEVIDGGFLVREFRQKCEERHRRLLVVRWSRPQTRKRVLPFWRRWMIWIRWVTHRNWYAKVVWDRDSFMSLSGLRAALYDSLTAPKAECGQQLYKV
jgi:hypothetical protein